MPGRWLAYFRSLYEHIHGFGPLLIHWRKDLEKAPKCSSTKGHTFFFFIKIGVGRLVVSLNHLWTSHSSPSVLNEGDFLSYSSTPSSEAKHTTRTLQENREYYCTRASQSSSGRNDSLNHSKGTFPSHPLQTSSHEHLQTQARRQKQGLLTQMECQLREVNCTYILAKMKIQCQAWEKAP